MRGLTIYSFAGGDRGGDMTLYAGLEWLVAFILLSAALVVGVHSGQSAGA